MLGEPATGIAGLADIGRRMIGEDVAGEDGAARERDVFDHHKREGRDDEATNVVMNLAKAGDAAHRSMDVAGARGMLGRVIEEQGHGYLSLDERSRGRLRKERPHH